MRVKLVGNKADGVFLVCKNAEASASMVRGQVAVYKLGTAAATDDGLAVVLPSTAGGNTYSMAFGVLTGGLAPNIVGEAQVFGYCAYALVITLTRSASSAVWPSIASSGSGAILQIDTANNCFSVFSASAAQTNFQPFAVLLDSLASQTTQASTTAGTGSSATASTAGKRVFVRFL